MPESADLTREPKYTDYFDVDYCGFRLKFLAKKIKSGYLKLKKGNIDFIIHNCML